MNYQQKAEAYVREHCPELGFTVVCRHSAKHPSGVRKTWRKPQLQHWVFECNGPRPNKTTKFEDFCDDPECMSLDNQRVIAHNQALDDILALLTDDKNI